MIRRNRSDDEDDDQEYGIRERVRDMDLYDQRLIDLRYLMAEKQKLPKDEQVAINILIKEAISDIYELGRDVVPLKITEEHIATAKLGGRYIQLVKLPKTDNDIIQLRKKKRVVRKKRVVKKRIVKKINKKRK